MYLAAVALICFMSSSSIPDIPKTFLGIDFDKIIHCGMFLPYPIMAFLSFDHDAKKKWKRVVFIAVSMLIGLAIAMGTEVVQYYLPTRVMDIEDFFADAIGIGISTAFVLIVDITRK